MALKWCLTRVKLAFQWSFQGIGMRILKKKELEIEQENYLKSLLKVLDFRQEDNSFLDEDKSRFEKEFNKVLRRRNLQGYINDFITRRSDLFEYDDYCQINGPRLTVGEKEVKPEESIEFIVIYTGKDYSTGYIKNGDGCFYNVSTDLRMTGKDNVTAVPIPMSGTFSKKKINDFGPMNVSTQAIDVENAVFAGILNLIIEIYEEGYNEGISLRDFLKEKQIFKKSIKKIDEIKARKLNSFFFDSDFFDRRKHSIRNELEFSVTPSAVMKRLLIVFFSRFDRMVIKQEKFYEIVKKYLETNPKLKQKPKKELKEDFGEQERFIRLLSRVKQNFGMTESMK